MFSSLPLFFSLPSRFLSPPLFSSLPFSFCSFAFSSSSFLSLIVSFLFLSLSLSSCFLPPPFSSSFVLFFQFLSSCLSMEMQEEKSSERKIKNLDLVLVFVRRVSGEGKCRGKMYDDLCLDDQGFQYHRLYDQWFDDSRNL